MRLLGLLMVTLLAGFTIWAAQDLPERGDPEAPAARNPQVSVYYIENAYTDSATPNMVTAVLADYRGFDTFGEAVVVVAAALSCLLILLRRREDEEGGGLFPPPTGAPGKDGAGPDGAGKGAIRRDGPGREGAA
jgi:multicomponent Na+:H+ antiporter subunit B